jgi:hypothetical protein
MKSYRVPFYLVAVLLVLAIGYIVVQYKTIQQLTKEIAELGPKSGKANQLREENAALSGELKAMQEQTDAEHRELLRLRGQISTMRDKDKEIAQLKSESEQIKRQLQNASSASIAPVTPERKRTIARLSFSKQLGLSLIMAAADNQEQLPQNLDGLDGKYLRRTAEMDEHNLQIGQFEMLYKGRLGESEDPSRTVLAREKEALQRADGTWELVYVFVDGHAQVLAATSREQLARLEKDQFILPASR